MENMSHEVCQGQLTSERAVLGLAVYCHRQWHRHCRPHLHTPTRFGPGGHRRCRPPSASWPPYTYIAIPLHLHCHAVLEIFHYSLIFAWYGIRTNHYSSGALLLTKFNAGNWIFVPRIILPMVQYSSVCVWMMKGPRHSELGTGSQLVQPVLRVDAKDNSCCSLQPSNIKKFVT